MFFRRRVFHDYGLHFDASYRDVADAVWMIAALRHPLRCRLLPVPTTAFTDDGQNMNLRPNAVREKAVLAASAPAWARRLRWLLRAQHQAKKALRGAYLPQRPLAYSLYTKPSPATRVTFEVEKPAAVWRSRL